MRIRWALIALCAAGALLLVTRLPTAPALDEAKFLEEMAARLSGTRSDLEAEAGERIPPSEVHGDFLLAFEAHEREALVRQGIRSLDALSSSDRARLAVLRDQLLREHSPRRKAAPPADAAAEDATGRRFK